MNDLMYEKYKDKIWNLYELVFIKGNRGIPLNNSDME